MVSQIALFLLLAQDSLECVPLAFHTNVWSSTNSRWCGDSSRFGTRTGSIRSLSKNRECFLQQYPHAVSESQPASGFLVWGKFWFDYFCFSFLPCMILFREGKEDELFFFSALLQCVFECCYVGFLLQKYFVNGSHAVLYTDQPQ